MANKKRKCKQCGEYKLAEKGIKTPLAWFCCHDHAVLFAQDKQAKQKQKQIAKAKQSQAKKEKDDRANFRARKSAIKPIAKLLSEAQSAFNGYIRIRDYHLPCISCDKTREAVEIEQGWKTGGCWDAGHFMTRGAKGQLRFVLFNVHKQCKSCNAGGGKFSHKAATVDQKYRINIIKKIGLEKVELLENNNDIDLNKKDRDYLERIKVIFNRKTRLYKKKFRDIQ